MVKIEWAPLFISARRRMETLTVAFYMFCLFNIGLFSYLYFALVLVYGNIYWKIILLLYAAWIYLDRQQAQNSARGSGVPWMRNNFFWKYFRNYFPVELVKTAELLPDRNYLLACYPHGVICFGAFTNMCIDISKWNELFPKVRVHLATLAMHFNTPIWRHILQSWGMVSATKESLVNNLTTPHDPIDPINSDGCTASAVGLLVGGSREALDAKPGKYIITIKKRKGFIKLALETGASIVPVFSFGEVDIMNQIDNPPDSFLRKIQLFVKQVTGISPVLYLGRGIFQYTFGLLPHRKRIVQVVGAPIHVKPLDQPSEDVINNLHQKFMESLNDLFETHKSKYINDAENTVLIMK